jgi:hypothetical protein
MLTWWMVMVVAQATQPSAGTMPLPAPVETRPPAGEAVPLETRLDKLKAEQTDVPVPTQIVVRNEMGKRFRLIEARFIVDGVEVAQRLAPKGQELARTLGPLATELPAGQHVVTAELVYEGRNAGPISYLDDIRYRVESTLPFKTDHLNGPATIEVVARERPGANVPFEKKPLLTLTAVNTPDTAPVAAPAPAQPPQGTSGVKPASTITH